MSKTQRRKGSDGSLKVPHTGEDCLMMLGRKSGQSVTICDLTSFQFVLRLVIQDLWRDTDAAVSTP